MLQALELAAFLTIFGTIFIAELTDKDAILLLTLATKNKPLYVFAAGASAFCITTAIIVAVGSVLTQIVPIFWVKLAGGSIMIVYAFWEYLRGRAKDGDVQVEEERLEKGLRGAKITGFLLVVLSLAVLDLAGDATELITILFVAHYEDALLVFLAAASALVAASAFETALGNRLGRLLTARRVRYLSIVVFLAVGTVTLLTSATA